jgi:pilus assembly protein CpaC
MNQGTLTPTPDGRIRIIGLLAALVLVSAGPIDSAAGQDDLFQAARGVLTTTQLGAEATAPPRQVWGEAPAPSPEQEARAQALIEEVVEPQIVMDLDPRRSKIVRAKRPVSRISITNPEILEVTQFSPMEFELIGMATGQTSLTLWFGEDPARGEMLRYLVRVSPNEAIEDRRKIEYGDLERKVNEMFPGSVVQLIPVADKLIVRGQARDAEDASAIMALIRGQTADALAAGALGSHVEGPAAQPYPGTNGLPQSNVINLLEVPGEMQVLLKVRVAELSRSALREMGADLKLDFSDFSFSSSLGLNGAVSAVLDTDEMKLTIEALSTNSYAKILAEPNLVTLSGHPAYFIAGGEFAVPIVVGVEGAAAATTNFRGFGTQLEFTPTVLDKDRIRLHVAPSFSSINQENQVDGIPGLDTRAVATTVDLREGQWLAIAGLIQDQQSGSKARVPLLGDIPYLDTVFSKKEVKRDESELLILVSPELVHPLEAEETPLILPGMEVTEPTDWAFFLGGRYEGRPGCDHRSTVWPVLRQQMLDARCEAKRQAKYQRCETYYIQGEYGFSR